MGHMELNGSVPVVDGDVTHDVPVRFRIARAVSTALLVASIVLLAVATYRRVDLTATDWTSLPKMFPGDSTATLVVFIFRPDDCPSAMNAIDAWNRVAGAGTARVRGLMIGDKATIDRPETIFAAQNVRFPTKIIDEAHAARILGSVGYSSTPATLVIDPHSRLRAAFPGGDARSASPAVLDALGASLGERALDASRP